MDMEQWLEEAMAMVNKWLCIMPSRVLRQCIESCHEAGWPLVSIVRAGSELGFVSEAKLLEIKEKVPEPLMIQPSLEELLALRNTHKAGLESARFLVNYSVGASKDMPVTVNFSKSDERCARDFHRVVRALVWQAGSDDSREE